MKAISRGRGQEGKRRPWDKEAKAKWLGSGALLHYKNASKWCKYMVTRTFVSTWRAISV